MQLLYRTILCYCEAARELLLSESRSHYSITQNQHTPGCKNRYLDVLFFYRFTTRVVGLIPPLLIPWNSA
jgi:hypothetical protein